MARMTRTQIMLDTRQMEVLERESTATGKSKSELIRLAIDAAYDQEAVQARRLEALERFLGRQYPVSEAGPIDRSPGWRERLHERGSGSRGR